MSTPLTPPAARRCSQPSGGRAAGEPFPQAPAQTLERASPQVHPGGSPEQINHYTVQRVLDVGANVEGRDLGAVAERHPDARSTALGKLPPGMKITLRGQNQVMNAVVPQPRARPHPRGRCSSTA